MIITTLKHKMNLYSKLNSPLHKNRVYKLYQSKRFVQNQDYYHPHDVPFYQTPSLGGWEKETEKPTPNDFVFRYIDLDPREKNFKHQIPSKDVPKLNFQKQVPENFLPEEPTFFEFWGCFPFITFILTFLVSKEFMVAFDHDELALLVLLPPIFTCHLMESLITKLMCQYEQFKIDQKWVKNELYRTYLKTALKNFTEYSRATKRNQDYANYLKRMNDFKLNYFSYMKEKKMKEEILNSLKRIKNSEESVKENFEIKYKFSNKKSFDNFINDNKNIKKWNELVQKFISESKENENKKFDIKNIIKNFEDQIKKENLKNDEDFLNEISIEKEPDHEIKMHLKNIYEILNKLKVYNGPKKAPEKIKIKDLNIFDKIDEDRKEVIVKKSIMKKGIKKFIDKQLSRFIKGKEPKELLELKNRNFDS